MAMQTDVKSAHSSASVASGGVLMVSGRYRLKSVVMASNTTAGTAIFLLELDSGTNSNVSSVLLPGQGILFNIGIFYVPTTVASIGVTVVYG
jgi:hypothetical protein